MSISYAKNSCFIKMPPYVLIGNKIYNTIKIGGVELVVSNIDNIGVETTNYTNYTYNGVVYKGYKCNDSTTELLRENIINFDNDGWEYFSASHYNQMFSSMEGTPHEKSIKFMAFLNENWPGTNELGTGFLPWGPNDLGERGYFCTNSTSGHAYLRYSNNVLNYSGNYSGISYAPLRIARFI